MLTNCYVTTVEVRSALNILSTGEDSSLESEITSACRAVDEYIGGSFYDAGSASARVYQPCNDHVLKVDGFSTITGLVVKTDTSRDGTFATTWASTDYELLPLSGGNYASRPYDTISAIGGKLFTLPVYGGRTGLVQVTARWGWAAVPYPIRSAALLISCDLWKRRDAPFGITTTEFGPIRVSGDIVGKLRGLVGPYRRHPMVA